MVIKFKQMSKMTKFTQKTGFSLLPHPVIPSCHPGQCAGITFYIVIPACHPALVAGSTYTVLITFKAVTSRSPSRFQQPILRALP